jgi:CheY-like chemotaxis protein
LPLFILAALPFTFIPSIFAALLPRAELHGGGRGVSSKVRKKTKMSKPIVLVIDDDEIQLAGFAFVLGREGYPVYEARNAKEGLAVLDSLLPDLILLDMMMPASKGDGWYFLKEVRKKPATASVTVIIVTAIGIASEEWAASLGANGLIRKPVDVETLLVDVKQCLRL